MFKFWKCTLVFALISNQAFANFPTPKPSVANIFLGQIQSVATGDAKNAKYLEDFYWAFRNKNGAWMKTSIANFKPRSPELLAYRNVIKDGWNIFSKLSSNQNINCTKVKIGFDLVSKKYYSLFRATCTREKLTQLLKSHKKLLPTDKSFLIANDYILSRNPYRNFLLEKIKSSSSTEQTFYSNYIKNYIYNHKRLPSIEFLEYLKTDAKITSFIQEHALFDTHDNKFFTKEFKRLISQFKHTFLDGDQESAAEALESAVTFYNHNQEKISNAKAWRLFFINGMSISREEHSQDLALRLFKFSEKVAEDENLFDSKFQTLLTYYQSNQLSKALAFINENRFVKNFNEINSKLRFWTAYIFDKRNEKVMAKDLYLKQISISPLSYYSILALKQLREINPHYTADVIIKPDSFDGAQHIALTKVAARNIKLFNIFSTAKSSFLTSLQGAQLRRITPQSFFSTSNEQTISNHNNFLLSFFSSQGEYLLSFKQAYSGLNQGNIELTPNVINSLFPTIYGNIIKSQNSPIDFRLILSLIRQESAFNKKAKSVVGARGLMQLMPQTARSFKRRLKSYQLFDPKLNINIGVKFLERLVRRYEGNLMFTLSAYNAGMGNVSKWQKSIPFGEDILLNVELIPFSETRKYVKLIYRNLFFYKYLDQDPAHLDLALNESFKVTLKGPDTLKH